MFCILYILFLDTCTVEAGFITSVPFSATFSVNPDTHVVDVIGASGTGYISNGTGSIVRSGGWCYYISEGQYHFSIPVDNVINLSDIGFTDFDYPTDKYYRFDIRLVNTSVNVGSISNVCLKSYNGDLLGLSGGYYGSYDVGTGSHFYNSTFGRGVLNYKVYVDFDYSYESNVKTDYGTTSSNAPSTDMYNLTCNFNLGFGFNEISESVYNSSIPQVSDSGTQNAIEEGNEVAEDTNSKITDFFGSFFDNLIGIFVPDDEFFSDWFDNVNTLLSDKLGMLYAPFDLVISTLQAIYSSDTTESGIPFPGIKWEDTWLVEPFTFTFASLGNSFDDLRDKVYFATDTVLVLTFLMLLQSKVKLILEGHE